MGRCAERSGSRPVKQFRISFPDPVAAALQTVATAQDRTISDLVREAVRMWAATLSTPAATIADRTAAKAAEVAARQAAYFTQDALDLAAWRAGEDARKAAVAVMDQEDALEAMGEGMDENPAPIAVFTPPVTFPVPVVIKGIMDQQGYPHTTSPHDHAIMGAYHDHLMRNTGTPFVWPPS